MTELMTQEEVSALFDITTPVLANWRCAGKGPRYVKLGGRVKYRKADVEEFINGSVRQSTTVAA
ncbi:MAG: helix-turn-helix domain-containing protein [Bradyrhizobium sp.]